MKEEFQPKIKEKKDTEFYATLGDVLMDPTVHEQKKN